MVLSDFLSNIISCCYTFNIFLSSDYFDDKVIARYCSFAEVYDFSYEYFDNEIKKLEFNLSSISIYISDKQVHT